MTVPLHAVWVTARDPVSGGKKKNLFTTDDPIYQEALHNYFEKLAELILAHPYYFQLYC